MVSYINLLNWLKMETMVLILIVMEDGLVPSDGDADDEE